MTTHSQTGSFDLSALNNLNQNLTQYFWFEEGGSGSYPWGLGAHVTLYPQSDFTNPNDSNYLKGQNILINTDGFSLRNGTIPLMALDNDSLDFNLITNLSQGTYVNVATFGIAGATIGQLSGAHSVIDADGQRFYSSSGTTLLANIGYGEGASHTGTNIAPYYTMGTRKPSSSIGNYSMAEGYGTTASAFNSHAEGYLTIASGEGSHAEGSQDVGADQSILYTTASGTASHAEGLGTTASGYGSHAQGQRTTASAIRSHAEGYLSTSSGNASHAEGNETTASGDYSHAEGTHTIASGNYSHAGGARTIAQRRAQTVIGSNNIADTYGNGTTDAGKFLLIIGNGTVSTPSNALTVDWDGNVDIHSGAKYTINGTALSADDVGAVPTTRTINNIALLQDIILDASDVGAVPTTRTVNSKALSSNITLSASDVGALPSPSAGSVSEMGQYIDLHASGGASDYDTRLSTNAATATGGGYLHINGKPIKDFVTESGTSSSWYYRKWKSGKVEAWRTYNAGSQTPAQWVTGWYYKDLDIAIPSGIFSAAPNHTVATNNGSDYQYTVHVARATSATNIRVRCVKPNSGAATPVIALYVSNMV